MGGNFIDQLFAKMRFICMLILSYSSFTRFKEIQGLLVGQLTLVDNDFFVQFFKGETYLESRFGIIPFLPTKDFNPAGVFLHYLEVVASMHAIQNASQDYIFPNITIKKNVVTLSDTHVQYNAFLKKLKIEASSAHLSCAELKLKLGLHSLRRGSVTRAVNAGTADFNVQKLMRVSSIGMVDYYSVAHHQFLLNTSNSAF